MAEKLKADKYFITDTNIYLLDPSALESFMDKNGNVHVNVIPYVVLNEIDDKKNHPNEEVSHNAREFSNRIFDYSKKGLVGDGLIRISENYFIKIVYKWDSSIENEYGASLGDAPDDQIIKVALDLKRKGEKIELVSNDTNLCVKAIGLGLGREEFGKWKAIRPVENIEKLFKGWSYVDTNENSVLSAISNRNYLEADFLPGIIGRKPYPNEYFIINEGAFIGRYDARQKRVLRVLKGNEIVSVYGIHGKNIQQKLAIDALMNPEIAQVNLIGPAGTGKTLLAIAAGLEQVLEKKQYKRIMGVRPLIASGKEIGYLKGDKLTKLLPWMGALADNLEMSMDEKDGAVEERRGKKEKDVPFGIVDHLTERGFLEFEAMAFIKGRSIKNKWMIVDEAQDLTPGQGKLACSRVAEGSKIVLTGDVQQIDNKVLDDVTNGLVAASEKMKVTDRSATIYLEKVERSGYAADVIRYFTLP